MYLHDDAIKWKKGNWQKMGTATSSTLFFCGKTEDRLLEKASMIWSKVYGQHGAGITFYDSYSTAAVLHVLLAKVMILY